MKYRLLGAALCITIIPGLSLADASLESRVQRLEQLLGNLQGRIDEQDQVIAYQDRTIQRQGMVIEQQSEIIDGQQKHLAKGTSAPGGSRFQSMELSGVVEVEANHTDPYSGRSTSDLTLATVEIGIGSQVNKWVRADIALLHEEDDTDLEVDIGTITIAPPDGNWFVTTGQFFMPFGLFESNMILDPLTLEIGEIRESALQIGFERDQFNGSVYAFNGSNKKDAGSKDRIDNWGANLGFSHEGEGLNLTAGMGFINDIGDSDSLQDSLSTNNVRNHIPGWAANGMAEAGGFVLIGEYLAATKDFETGELAFKGRGAEPKAWNVEIGYNFSLIKRDNTVAIAYQGTDEALSLGLPKRRLSASWSVDIFENTALSFEWAHDKDYSSSDGGTSENANTVTTQLAVGFP